MKPHLPLRKIGLILSLLILGASSGLATSTHEAPQAVIAAGNYLPFLGKKREPVPINSFAMDVTPVTNADFSRFVQTHQSWKRSAVAKNLAEDGYLKHWHGDFEVPREDLQSPVTQVSWFAARAYCKALGMRLPTLAEWEYAATSHSKDSAAIGKTILEWYGRPTPAHLPAVGQSRANSFGLQDLHGLIWEWTEDYGSSFSETDGQNFACGNGAADAADPKDYAAFMRFAMRASLKAHQVTASLGFRCAGPLLKPTAPAATAAVASTSDQQTILKPDGKWQDQSGKNKPLSDFVGSPTILAMFYTSCQTACPMTVERLKRLERKLPAALRSKMQFLLVSLDPARDAPLRLKEFSKLHHLDKDRWNLLAGDEDSVRSLAALLNIRYRNESDGTIIHTMAVTLLDTQGAILAQDQNDGIESPKIESKLRVMPISAGL